MCPQLVSEITDVLARPKIARLVSEGNRERFPGVSTGALGSFEAMDWSMSRARC